jgi:hypothetical protein
LERQIELVFCCISIVEFFLLDGLSGLVVEAYRHVAGLVALVDVCPKQTIRKR